MDNFLTIKICHYFFAVLFLFTVMLLPAGSTPPTSSDERNISSLEASIKLQSNRDKSIRIAELLDKEIIKIRPGMTILDIGAGMGLSAYEFAARLKGEGKVFATDILTDRIDYIKKEVDKRGLWNLYPVLVKREGVDKFYSKHKYDLIFLSNVYHRLDSRIDYFREMRKFLAKDGELIVIMSKNVFLFYEDDIVDFKGLLNELSQELHENEPFYKRLRQSTRILIKKHFDDRLNEALMKAIINDFNQILLDPQFYKGFQQTFMYKTVFFLPGEQDLYNWLLMCLKEEGALDKLQKDLTPKEIRAVIKLNKLLFLQRFRKYFRSEYEKKEEPLPPLFVGYVHRQTSRFLVERELSEAGYKLTHEYDALPYHVILFFAANEGKERK